MHPVRLFCWHFMAYPYLPSDFDARYDSGWVTVPNALWNRDRAGDLYQEYIDQLVYADELGFDGMVLNEHHQNIYGLMPSPNIIAAALTQRTKHGKIVVLGNLLPLHRNPLRVAEEYAMIDNMSGAG
jgi:alkanesulfonate monooxygenase SsuD/methylene tetrahydromethanopterin reductase-like flavin-dependent oxidoreductase (luciferase family)